MQMSLNVKTPENACIFHFRGGFKLKRVIERGGGGGGAGACILPWFAG